jgi:hypothetical protein
MKITVEEASLVQLQKGEVTISAMSGTLLAKFTTDAFGGICQVYPPRSLVAAVRPLTTNVLRTHIVRNVSGQVVDEYQTYS